VRHGSGRHSPPIHEPFMHVTKGCGCQFGLCPSIQLTLHVSPEDAGDDVLAQCVMFSTSPGIIGLSKHFATQCALSRLTHSPKTHSAGTVGVKPCSQVKLQLSLDSVLSQRDAFSSK